MATPFTINLPGGGQIVTNASSPQAAMDNTGNISGATVSAGSYSTPGNQAQQSAGGGGQQQQQQSGGTGSGSGALDQSLQKMLQALASGNAQAFQESKDEFNKNYELAVSGVTGSYQGNPTAAVDQFNKNLAQQASQFAQTFGLSQQTAAQNNAATVAGLTGYYNAPGAAGGGAAGAAGGGDINSLTQVYTTAKANLDAKVATANQAIAAYQANPGNAQLRDAASAAQNAAYQADQDTHTAQNAVYAASQNQPPAAGGGAAAGGAGSGQGTPTLANTLQQANIAAQQAGLYGQAGAPAAGQQTLASILQNSNLSGQYNGAPTESAREFNQTQAQALLQAATQLRGPSDYLQYQNLTHGGQSLMQQLFGNGQAGATAQPAGQLQSANLQNSLGDLGLQQGQNGLAPINRFGAPQPQQSTGNAPAGYVNADMGMGAQPQPAMMYAGGTPGFNENTGTYGPPSVGGTPLRGTANDAYLGGGGQTPAQLAQMQYRQQLAGGIQPTQQQPGMYSALGQQQPGGSGQADPSASILMQSFGLSPGSTLNPNQIDPSRWDAMGATGQALTKNLASTMFGYDPNDFEAQVNATRPQGTAQRTSQYASAAPQGLF